MRPDDRDRPHVVLVHRHFYPDTPPYATILRDIAVTLANSGLDVTVLSCQPSYHGAAASRAPADEVMAPRLRIRRWPVLPDRSSLLARLANLLIFVSRAVLTLARMRRVDVVMAASTPPVFVALFVSLIARIRGFAFVYHKQDIYPEIMSLGGSGGFPPAIDRALGGSGGVPPGVDTALGGLPPLVRSLLGKLDAGTDSRARAVVVLSTDMEATVRARGGRLDQIAVINNYDPWMPPPELTPHRSAERVGRPEGAELKIIYAGNIGRFQNIPRIAELMAYFSADPRVFFDIVGDGPLRPWLEQFAERNALRNVCFHGYVAPDQLATMMRQEFDVGIVSLRPGVIRNAYPSKTLSYLRNGLGVLALVETDSQLTRTLRRYGAGWSADPTSPAGVEDLVQALLDGPDAMVGLGERARSAYESEFSRARQLRRWSDLFDDLLGTGARQLAELNR
jgi:glycosyltransferase involved in cell wall biosynthesis